MIVAPSERDAWWNSRGPCFYCGDDLPADRVTVMWAGKNGSDIGLHINCAEKLGMHLMGDVREARLAQGDGVWGIRADRLKKAKLERQEWGS